MEEIDTDKSGGIDFEEFLDFMTTERGSRKASSDASEYSDIFDFMDVDKNGLISAEDLKKVQILVFLFDIHFRLLSDNRETWTETFKSSN